MMKYVVFILLIISCSLQKKTNTKKHYTKFDLTSAIQETKSIMNHLSIRIRENIKMDDSLRVYVNPAETNFNANFGSETPEKGLKAPQNHIELRYYILPLIEISSVMDSIIFNKKDTSYLIYMKGTSIIIHEISHYLQETWDDNYFKLRTMADEKRYISQPTEIESYAVGSYYFLSHFKPVELKEIMSSNETIHRKYELLINAYRKYVYSEMPILF